MFSTDFRVNLLIEEDIDVPKDLNTFYWQVIQLYVRVHLCARCICHDPLRLSYTIPRLARPPQTQLGSLAFAPVAARNDAIWVKRLRSRSDEL